MDDELKPHPGPFYRTVIEIEVLSEEPFVFDTLEQVRYSITEGHCSGTVTTTVGNEVMTGAEAAAALLRQRSDPEFFNLTEDGCALDEEW